MRIDITTPITTKVEEKKESKIIKAKSGYGNVAAAIKAQLEGDLTREDAASSQAQVISFLEEKKKRRGKLKSQTMGKYLKIVDALTNPYENVRGKTLNIRV